MKRTLSASLSASEFPIKLSKSITFLGIDPGLRRTGYAVAETNPLMGEITRVIEVGLVETEPRLAKQVRKTSDDMRRARIHAFRLKTLVADYKIALVAMEMSTTTPYTLPTFSFGVMTGVVASLGVEIVEVLPYEVKQAATGDPRGTKSQVIEWAMAKSGPFVRGWPMSRRRNSMGLCVDDLYVGRAAEHPADALAAVQAALRTEQFRMAISISQFG